MDKEDFPLFDMEWMDPVVRSLQKFVNGQSLSAEELLHLDSWKKQTVENGLLFNRLQDQTFVRETLRKWNEIEKNREWNKQRGIYRVTEAVLKKNRLHLPFYKKTWFRAAAAVLIFFGAGIYWLKTSYTGQPPQATVRLAPKHMDVMPGSNKAVLTLGNGRKVELNDSLQQLTIDGKLTINNRRGELSYGNTDYFTYNTMSTPRGGQYRLALPDGSRVWLNAASSITYPTVFKTGSRNVSITGEVYFEVARDKTRPFVVSVAGKETIEVLGTHFNVNAYHDEPSATISLLEGSINIDGKLLHPGEMYRDGRVAVADVQQAVAWKEGVFNFQDKSIEEVMRQLSRWYDIDVVYGKDLPKLEFYGKMGRDLNLAQVLSILKRVGVKFRIDENKKLVVYP